MGDIEQATGGPGTDAQASDEPTHDAGGDRRERFTQFVAALDRVLEHAINNGEVYEGAIADHQTIVDVLLELRAELHE